MGPRYFAHVVVMALHALVAKLKSKLMNKKCVLRLTAIYVLKCMQIGKNKLYMHCSETKNLIKNTRLYASTCIVV